VVEVVQPSRAVRVIACRTSVRRTGSATRRRGVLDDARVGESRHRSAPRRGHRGPTENAQPAGRGHRAVRPAA
jgi:hypothetical protein